MVISIDISRFYVHRMSQFTIWVFPPRQETKFIGKILLLFVSLIMELLKVKVAKEVLQCPLDQM